MRTLKLEFVISYEHSLCDFVATLEIAALQAALEITGNNKTRAANLLGIKRTTFVMKLKKHGLPVGVRRAA